MKHEDPRVAVDLRNGSRPRMAIALVATVSLALSFFAVPLAATSASAANGSDFDPGNIISDAVFFDSSTMNAAQVQQFLDLKGAACVPGEQPCLKDYSSPVPDRAAENGLCSGYTSAPSQSAAEIIVGVARSCGVNPRVLIVLLEKENSLVTKTRPTSRNYQAAAGYGCPDTAPCDQQYYGLFNQLYMAARQFEKYAASPKSYSYAAGRQNTILWSPNAACGTSSVYIDNQATAGLYDYTPYRPNAAALANLYGLGDACSSYGNRNFWVFFTDWFGSTQFNTFLVRTASNATVYLVSGSSKYPIPSMAILGALAPLGGVGFVSQQYLDHLSTGGLVKRALLSPNGTVYYFDAGIKLWFSSCAQVADFGMTCGDAVAVGAGVIAALADGGAMQNVFRTTSGRAYYISGGQRHEIEDTQALVDAGLPTGSVTLLDSGIDYLPLGTPIVRPKTVLRSRDDGATYVVTQQPAAVLAPPAMLSVPGLAGLPVLPMDAASIAKLSPAGTLGPVVKDGNGVPFLLTTSGRRQIDADAAGTAAGTVPDDLLSLVPDEGPALTSPVFVLTPSGGTVYLLRHGELRPIPSWTDLVGLAGARPLAFETVPAGSPALLPAGPLQPAPGTLVVAPGNGTVYLTDGYDSKVPVASFSVSNEIGATRLVWLSSADIARFTSRPDLLSTAVQCGSDQYLGLSGRLVPLPSTMDQRYGVSTFTQLDPLTCAQLPRASQPLDRFLRTPDGTIWYMDAGQKRPIGAFSVYVAAGGSAANTTAVSATSAARFVTGPPYAG